MFSVIYQLQNYHSFNTYYIRLKRKRYLTNLAYQFVMYLHLSNGITLYPIDMKIFDHSDLTFVSTSKICLRSLSLYRQMRLLLILLARHHENFAYT
jgi:hypothetical protein